MAASRRTPPRRNRLFAVSPVFLFFCLTLWLAIFWNVLFGSDQFTYRDESHFHYPLFHYIQAELEMGRFPLWTPYDNIGQPLFANAALAVLYPGKLIFFLPLEYSVLYNLFITCHVLVAALTLYRLARAWGAGTWGATLGALSYGFAGTILGQYCSLIFVIGAAWVPEAVLHADRMLTRRSPRSALLCAAVLSIMSLGGDPQAAFHVGMAASLLALFRWRRERLLLRSSGAVLERSPTNFSRRLSPFRLIRHRAVLLAIVAGATFLFSAVQVIPSQEYSKLCNRSGYKNPRTIWEIPRFLMADEKDIDASAKEEILFDDSAIQTRASADVARQTRWQRIYNGIFHEGSPDPHQMASYNFSEHPIQFLGFFWSQIEGLPYPRLSTWLGGVFKFSSATNWFLTLYMGVVPLLLALVSLRFRFVKQANIRVVWLSWLLVLCLWSGVGIYGFGWLLGKLGLPTEFSSLGISINPAIGGGYWFLQTFVPGYILFRYPAKLLTLAAFPIAMLAAFGFDRLSKALLKPRTDGETSDFQDRSLRWFRRLSVLVLALSLLFLIPASMRDQWYALARFIPAGDTTGPFVPDLARFHVVFSLLQTLFVLGSVLLLLRRRSRMAGKVLLTAILAIVSIDLYLSCKKIVFTTDRSVYTRDESVVTKRIVRESRPEPVRIILNLKSLSRWIQQVDADRLADFATRNRQQLESQCHYALPHNSFGNLPIAKADEAGTLVPYSYEQWVRRNVRNDYRFETNLRTIGVEYALMDISRPLDPRLATLVMQYGQPEAPGNWPENLALWKLNTPGNRVRIEGRDDPGESARIVHYEPSRVVLEAELRQPGTVVLSDQFWPGWHLEIETLDRPGGEATSRRPGEIRAVNDIFRGVDLESGDYRLTYRYAPESFRNGAIISGTSWALYVVFFVVGMVRSRKKK